MKATFILIILLFSAAVFGQTTISGTVTDAKGNGVPGANVYLKGTYDGTSTDARGAYSFETQESGKRLLTIQAVGFQARETAVECTGTPLHVTAKLAEQINMLNAVTITAGAMEASDEKKSVVLKPLDIVTTSGAMGDITAALLTLPGTSTVGNDGRLFVRGGDASETAIFIDGMQVGNAFGSTASNVPTRTRFSPNLFKGSFFSTGGYSAEYGQALSSALVLNTVDLPLLNQGDLSLMSLGGGYTQTLVGKQQALTASANYYNLAPYQSLVRQNFDWEQAPASWDSEISLRQKWDNAAKSNAGMLKAYVHTEGSRMTIWQKAPGRDDRGDRVQLRNHYAYGNLSFRQSYGNGWLVYGGAAYSHNRDAWKLNLDPVRQTTALAHGKAVAVKDFSDRFSLKNGFEWYARSYAEALTSRPLRRDFTDHQLNHFAEASYYFSNRLVVVGGMRTGYSTLARQAWLDPRFSMAYKFDNQGQVSLAAGRFHQLPEEKMRIHDVNLKNTLASHYIINYFITSNGRSLRAEAFYKNYGKLVTWQGEADAPRQIAQDGGGYARGFDLFYRDKQTVKGTDFWFTYSFVDSKRRYGTYATRIQPSFAPTHNGSVVAKHFVGHIKSQLGLSWSWNSGYPYQDPNRQMQRKTGMYSDLSLSWSFLPRPNIIIHAACSNVLGRHNTFGYRYATQPDETGHFASLPVGQGAGRFAFVGLFITLSKDKNANQLNNL